MENTCHRGNLLRNKTLTVFVCVFVRLMTSNFTLDKIQKNISIKKSRNNAFHTKCMRSVKGAKE